MLGPDPNSPASIRSPIAIPVQTLIPMPISEHGTVGAGRTI
jgi:hypothetical protein